MEKHNIAVRNAAEKHHKYLWEVAALMGISYSGFMQKMRFEWSEEEQKRVVQLIENAAEKAEDKYD